MSVIPPLTPETLRQRCKAVFDRYSTLPLELQAVRADLLGAAEALALAHNDAEQLRVQLAGCLVAAEGGTSDPATQGQYGWSLAYQRVLDLHVTITRLQEEIHGLHSCAIADAIVCQQLEAEIAALTAREKQAWQPITTAPKQPPYGEHLTKVLLSAPHIIESWAGYAWEHAYATHWQPLPAPPEIAASLTTDTPP